MKECSAWPGEYNKALRFALLFHSHCSQGDHFDLVLELKRGRKLWTLKQSVNPFITSSTTLSIHGFIRRRYLSFEGDIGRKRGVVRQVLFGTYTAAMLHSKTILTFHTGGKAPRSYSMGHLDQDTLKLYRHVVN